MHPGGAVHPRDPLHGPTPDTPIDIQFKGCEDSWVRAWGTLGSGDQLALSFARGAPRATSRPVWPGLQARRATVTHMHPGLERPQAKLSSSDNTPFDLDKGTSVEACRHSMLGITRKLCVAFQGHDRWRALSDVR